MSASTASEHRKPEMGGILLLINGMGANVSEATPTDII